MSDKQPIHPLPEDKTWTVEPDLDKFIAVSTDGKCVFGRTFDTREDAQTVANAMMNIDKRNAQIASLAAENAALADQVDRLRDRLELLTTAAENVEPQITRGGLEEEDAFIVARQQARRLLSSLKSDNP